MHLIVGKCYKARNGEIVKIVKQGHNLFFDTKSRAWKSDGKDAFRYDEENDLDLVQELYLDEEAQPKKGYRVWFREQNDDGIMESERQFFVDDLPVIPRVGEFVDGDECGGWVHHVQHTFFSKRSNSIKDFVVHVYLRKDKPK